MKIDKRRYWEIVGTVCINDTPASSADAVSGQLSIQDHCHVCSQILPRTTKKSLRNPQKLHYCNFLFGICRLLLQYTNRASR